MPVRPLAVALLAAFGVGASWAGDFKWDVPGAIEAVEVPGVQVTNGIPTRFTAYRSKLPLEDLAGYFARAFLQAHLFVPPPKEQMELTDAFQITAFDPKKMQSYTVILKPNPDHTTTVITGEALLKQWVDSDGVVPDQSDFAPLYPNAQRVSRTSSEGIHTLSYDVEARPAELDEFYKQVMGRAGYKSKTEGIYQKGNQRVTVRHRVDPNEPKRLDVFIQKSAHAPDDLDTP